MSVGPLGPGALSFVDRGYPDVVKDVLTTLTAGVAAEVHTAEATAAGAIADVVLDRRPVARVSQVSAYVADPGGDPDAEPRRVVLGLDDVELAPLDPSDPADRSLLRFPPTARRKPVAGTDIVVNYYPRTVDPTPIDDVSVGSVARTLVEAVAREVSVAYKQLNLAYESGFLESATGSSLDRVVALLGYRRYVAGRPVGTVRFSRRAGSPGEVTIPAGTPVADAKDTVRYETVETRTMLAGESTAELRVRGATAGTPVVEARVLSVVQRAIAGIDGVINEAPTSTSAQDESDVELRARARVALLAAARGTVPALTHGLLALPQVRAVDIEERPEGVPGEIRVSVSLTEPPADGSIPPEVIDAVEELRPAGIRVLLGKAGELALAARVRLVLAGSSMPSAQREQVHTAARAALLKKVAAVQVGQRVRTGALQAALVDGDLVLDASITLTARDSGEAGTAGADFVSASRQAVRLSDTDVTFDADLFDTPTTGPAPVPVEVRATVRPAAPGVDALALRAGVRAKLTSYVATLAAPTVVDAASLLTAVRDDAAYALDPLGLVVTFTSGDQFVQVASGGSTFTVAAGQTFTVAEVEVLG
jgi:uncharacterized phage protein gp47/JayE